MPPKKRTFLDNFDNIDDLLTTEEKMILQIPTTEEERLNWLISSKKYLQDRY
jgi:hypothetical protein